MTTVTGAKSDHLWRLPFHQSVTNEYIRNIQINDLNALTATLAVIKWKKMWGFYAETEPAHATTYSVAGNVLANEEVE